MKKIILFFVFCVCCAFPKSGWAADIVSLESQVRELTRVVGDLQLTVENQQREIAILKGQAPPPFTVSAGPPSSGSRSPQGRWNPDIGVVADTVLKLDSPKTDAEGADRISVRELELVLGSAVDPYSRFDATISFSDFEAAGLEEATLTRFELPWELTARVGRFKPRIGKALSVHRDSLETVDEPLMIQRYFGPEGYNRTGADVGRTLDLPWPSVHAVNFGVLEGSVGEPEVGRIFGTDRRHPSLYSHLKNYWDISDLTNFELGFSHLVGSKDADAHWEAHLLALDATLVHHLNANQNLKIQSEVFSHQSDVADLDGSLWAAYVLADFRFHPRWSAGFRLDYAELIDNPAANPEGDETEVAGVLTFYQSEFARWRLQFAHVGLANSEDDNQIMLQGTFAIGEHKHKIQ